MSAEVFVEPYHLTKREIRDDRWVTPRLPFWEALDAAICFFRDAFGHEGTVRHVAATMATVVELTTLTDGHGALETDGGVVNLLGTLTDDPDVERFVVFTADGTQLVVSNYTLE